MKKFATVATMLLEAYWERNGVSAEIISVKEVKRVDFYLDKKLFRTVYEAPYEFTYHAIAFLNHKIRASAYVDGKSSENEIAITCLA